LSIVNWESIHLPHECGGFLDEISINTGTMPTGNEIELCKFLKKKFDAEGIMSEVVESEPTRGNFIARLNGQDDGKAKLMFMSHTIDSPSNDEFLQAIKASLITTMGESIEIMPTLTIGLTDSCAVRPLGTIVYNFAPTHPDSDPGNSNVHGDNESMSVEDLVFRTKVLVALACNLLT